MSMQEKVNTPSNEKPRQTALQRGKGKNMSCVTARFTLHIF